MATPDASNHDGNHTPMHPLLRAWLGAEIFFSLVASLATFINPRDAATGFAWPIPVTVMAAVLGIFYAASLPVTIWSVRMKYWQEVRVLAVPLGIFAAFMTLMTFIHWDKFSHGTAPFYVWMVSYVAPPVLFAYFYWVQQKDSAPVGTGITHPFPAWVRTLLGVNGALLILIALGIWVLPDLLVQHAPWKLTPLTARTLANMLLAAGIAQAWMYYEADWRRTRLASLLLILVGVLFHVQLGRFGAEVQWGSKFLWVVLSDVTAIALVLAWVWHKVGRGNTV